MSRFPVLRTAAIAFVATLLVAAGAFVASFADRYAERLAALDSEIILLFLPCCLIVFGLLVEATRLAVRGVPEKTVPVRQIVWDKA